MEQSLPQVRRYLCVATYLQDYYKFRKLMDSKFSYEEWAAELGFKSRTYMRLLCQGKRALTSDFVDIFSEKINLSGEDREHLILLSLYDQAKGPQYKEIYRAKILSSLASDEYQLDLKEYTEFLSCLSLPLIHTLLAVNNLQATDVKLAHLLTESVEFIQLRLVTLQKMGLASQKDGIWFSIQRSFKVQGESRNQALALYNKNNLKEAESFISQHDEIKRFRSVHFAFNEEQIVEMDKEIENFFSFLKNKYSCPKSNSDRYFKMNLQLYPVTQPLQIEEPKASFDDSAQKSYGSNLFQIKL